VHRLDERIAKYDRHIAQMAREDERAKRLMQLRGVGETTATALLAMIGNGHEFASGRQLSAWLGLVSARRGWGASPRQ
jgi:transposase